MNAALRALCGGARARPDLWRARCEDLAPRRRRSTAGARGHARDRPRRRRRGLPRCLGVAARRPGSRASRPSRGDAGAPIFVLLHGSPWLAHDVAGLPLRSHALAFFQANRFLVEDLARSVLDLVPPEGPVLDLYAGVGLFALPLAQARTGVRGGGERRDRGRRRARERAPARARAAFRIEAPTCARRSRPGRAEEARAVVLDPPRTGAGLDVVERDRGAPAAAVVYVSCDPPTLGRDLAHFASRAIGPTPCARSTCSPTPSTSRRSSAWCQRADTGDLSRPTAASRPSAPGWDTRQSVRSRSQPARKAARVRPSRASVRVSTLNPELQL